MIKRPALPIYHPASFLATWFGSGLIRKAPGTWGSLAALPCGWALLAFGGRWVLVGAIVLVFFLGLWAAGLYARALGGVEDPGEIVIDEVAGQWIAVLAIALSPMKPYLFSYGAAFLLFRLFDIWKPWPVGTLDRKLKGALGIMADDIAAGLYAAIFCILLFGAFGYGGLWQAVMTTGSEG